MDVAALPVDCLLHVFSHVDFTTRQSALPLVCKSWRDALQGPSPAWEEVLVRAQLQLRYYNGPLVATWFSTRVGCITKIAVTDLHFPIQEVIDGLAQHMAPRLEELRTRMPLGGTQLARLASLPFTKLRCLHAEIKSRAEGKLLEQLPALEELKVIQYMEMHGGVLDSLTALSRLTYLSLMTAGGLPQGTADKLPRLGTLCLMEHVGNQLPAEVLRMGTQLTALQLKTFLFHEPIQVPPQLTKLTGLKNLWLSDVRLATTVLSSLTGLTALALVECGLTSVPDLRALSPSLRGLALTGNRIVTLPTWLTDMQALEEVDINQQGDRVALDVDVLEALLPPLPCCTGAVPSATPTLHLSVTYTSTYYSSPMAPAPAWGAVAHTGSSGNSSSSSSSSSDFGIGGGTAAGIAGKHFRSLYVDRSRRYWMTCGGLAVPLQHHKHAFRFINWPPPGSVVQQETAAEAGEAEQTVTPCVGGSRGDATRPMAQPKGLAVGEQGGAITKHQGSQGRCPGPEEHAGNSGQNEQVARMEAALTRLNACTRFYLSAIAGIRHF